MVVALPALVQVSRDQAAAQAQPQTGGRILSVVLSHVGAVWRVTVVPPKERRADSHGRLRTLARRSMRLSADHSFLLPHASSLAVSLALDRGSDAGEALRSVSWGVVGSLRPWADVTLDAGLRGINAKRIRQLNGSVDADWAIVSRWSLRAQSTASSGQDYQPL